MDHEVHHPVAVAKFIVVPARRMRNCLPSQPPGGTRLSSHAEAASRPQPYIPGNELDKVVVEGNASPSIEGRRVSVAVEVAGDNLGEERATYGAPPGSRGLCRHTSPLTWS